MSAREPAAGRCPRPAILGGRLHLRFDGVSHQVGCFLRSHLRRVHELGDRVHHGAAVLLQHGHVVRHRADQRAGFDRGLQLGLRLLLAGVEALRQVDVETRRDRALGDVEHRLELRATGSGRGEQLLAFDCSQGRSA